MKKIQSILLSFLLFSFTTKDENEIYLNYLVAARNPSTISYNLVFKFKNLNNGEIKEICVDGNLFRGAIYRENKLIHNELDDAKFEKIIVENKERYFEFKNQEVIERLNDLLYNTEDLRKIESEIDFDKLAKEIKKTKKWRKSADEKILIMYAHELFNRGILTGQNDCMGGGELMYIDRNNPY